MPAALPVRQYAETNNGVYFKVNETHNVIHCTKGGRLCCIDCRSNTCVHVAAVAELQRDRQAAA